MNKKITILGLSLLLSSSMVMATPFDDEKVTLDTSASESSLETATLDAKEEKVTDTSTSTNTESSNKKDSQESSADSGSSSTSEYTVVAGDCLSAIAAKLLGDLNRWPEIVELNKGKYPSLLSNPNLIYVGWTLTIPSKNGNTNSNSNNNTIASNDNSNTGSNTSTKTSVSTATNTQTSNNTNNNTSTTGKEIITSNSRVLHIGDSHSCGVYGKTIDNLMRETGAKVSTTAVAGSNPNWFMNGQVGTYGAYSRDENGKVTEQAYNQQAKTPLLQNMIDTYKPSVLVVSLGANMVGYSASTQRSMIENICDKAKAAGCKIVWVGPPDSRSQDDNQVANLYSVLKSEVEKYDGVLVDSRQYTEYPSSGGDGLHYSGTEGTAKAKTWANSVMSAIQGK